MNDMVKNILLWVVIAVVLMSVFNSFGTRSAPAHQLGYSQFIDYVQQGQVEQVTIDGRTIIGRTIGGEKFTTYSPETNNSALIGDLLDNNVEIRTFKKWKELVYDGLFASSSDSSSGI